MLPSLGFAEWGNEPAYIEIDRYSNVSLGFASQDIKSPVSNFGHTFLVFHNDETPEATSLTIEFTGEASDLIANISALFTSVPGKYSPSYLSAKIRQYDYENRSIWLYRLKLDKEELQKLKQYLLHSESTKFAYDFSQKNCAFYIAKALSQTNDTLAFKQAGLFVTPVSTLTWARSKEIISSEKYLPSTQLKALQAFEMLTEPDQRIAAMHLSPLANLPPPATTKQEIGNALSAMTEHLLPREADSSSRNHLLSIKKSFPSPSSREDITAEDPSRSESLASISTLFLPQRNAAIFTITPGFIRLENEAASGQRNSIIETLRTDLFTDTTGHFRVEQFHLAKIESNQPSGFLRDGFTQALDVSYADYRTHLDKNYKETKILFGRGVSFLCGGHIVSALPLISVIAARQDGGISANGRLEARFNIYKQLTGHTTYAAQLTRSVFQDSEIRQTMNLDLIYSISRTLSISFNLHQVMGAQRTSTLSGIRLTTSF